MPIGVIVNNLAVLLGGIIGAYFKNKIPERVCTCLPQTFGLAAVGVGISSITQMKTVPAVILALILGSALGETIRFEEKIQEGIFKLFKRFEKWIPCPKQPDAREEFMEKLLSGVILFCVGTTGIFGALQSGISGDHSILYTKAVLDFFTAVIFATSIGYVISSIAIPQFMIMITLFLSATFIMPLVNVGMLNDFSACGGIILVGTGLRVSGIKSFPVLNMTPALVLVMPLSYLWNLL